MSQRSLSQRLRHPRLGRIDRDRPLRFRFDGREYAGYAGDTLASALLANGVRVTGRSFRYHRPRGLFAAGLEEPNTLVQLGRGAATEPNLKATQIELRDGLEARAVNCYPGARYDWMSWVGWLKPLMPAGFYYKTFMAPGWRLYEGAIRAAAGLGVCPRERDPAIYDKAHASVDVLVVGAGSSGLRSALAAARRGASVLLVDDKPEPGGALLYEPGPIDGEPASAWLQRCCAELRARSNVTMLTRCTAFGYYDHDYVIAVRSQPGGGARQRLWKIRAGEVLLATGAIERPLVFPNNDRPGVMLAGAARHYLHRFGVMPGGRAVLATNNDSAYAVAFELQHAGVRVPAVLDTREEVDRDLEAAAKDLGIAVHLASSPAGVLGRRGVRGVGFYRGAAAVNRGKRQRLDCDALLLSGGWNPTVHLYSQAGGSLRFDEPLQTFVPERCRQNVRAVGAAAGDTGVVPAPSGMVGPSVPGHSRACAWVDLASDVTAADLDLAVRENFAAIEHVKRYTTAGMMSDQGKTSNVNVISIVAARMGRSPGDLGTTGFRPPFDPVTFGAIAGRNVGRFYHPSRRLPTHDHQLEAGARTEDYGGWTRPVCYPRAGEDETAAVWREVRTVREAVGVMDASPLGKILVHGPDATAFLQRVYANNVRTLQPGRCRYGLMLGEDGSIRDDGVLTRWDQQTYQVGTTSSQAGAVAEWLEEWLQCEWTDLDVLVEPVTTGWAVIAVAGPRARRLLDRLGTGIDSASEAFPHLGARRGMIGDVPLRVMRISFSGELGYELSVPWRYGASLWETLMHRGRDLGIAPFGIEALMAMRIEKGYLHVGTDTDGMTMPQDVGFGALIEAKQDDFIGRRSTMTPEAVREDRRQFVGLAVTDGRSLLEEGAHIVTPSSSRSEGWVTSSVHSPTLDRPVALALLERGRSRFGETVAVLDGGRTVAARVVAPAAYDPEGVRLRA